MKVKNTSLSKDNWAAAWDFQQCGKCDQQSLRSACAYAQSDQSLCLSLEYSMNVKLLTVSNVKRRLHRLVWVYTCQNATLLETTCHGSYIFRQVHFYLHILIWLFWIHRLNCMYNVQGDQAAEVTQHPLVFASVIVLVKVISLSFKNMVLFFSWTSYLIWC